MVVYLGRDTLGAAEDSYRAVMAQGFGAVGYCWCLLRQMKAESVRYCRQMMAAWGEVRNAVPRSWHPHLKT